MTTVVVDANIFLRYIEAKSPQHPTVRAAVRKLISQGFKLVSFEQTGYEFWTVATRPLVNNGLGLLPAESDAELDDLLLDFPLFEDKPGQFAEWRTLVTSHSVSGKPAHDARYVAGMVTYGITHILTFNISDFTRFPGITPLDPTLIAASNTP